MQHKLPIVSSNVGGIVEEVKNGENGYITKAGDDKTLADALGKLIDNKGLRIKLGNKSYEMYRQSFTKDKFEFNIEGILTNCLEEY